MILLLPLLSLSQSYPTQRIEGKDTVVVMTKKQADNINVIFKNTKTQIDKLKIELDSVTKIKPTVIRDTVIKKERGSILIPNSDYLLYNYNEKNSRYELDSQSAELAKIKKEERKQDRIAGTMAVVGFFIMIAVIAGVI
jgi:hypothetical protein